jgi:hypothetical protein
MHRPKEIRIHCSASPDYGYNKKPINHNGDSTTTQEMNAFDIANIKTWEKLNTLRRIVLLERIKRAK